MALFGASIVSTAYVSLSTRWPNHQFMTMCTWASRSLLSSPGWYSAQDCVLNEWMNERTCFQMVTMWPMWVGDRDSQIPTGVSGRLRRPETRRNDSTGGTPRSQPEQESQPGSVGRPLVSRVCLSHQQLTHAYRAPAMSQHCARHWGDIP